MSSESEFSDINLEELHDIMGRSRNQESRNQEIELSEKNYKANHQGARNKRENYALQVIYTYEVVYANLFIIVLH